MVFRITEYAKQPVTVFEKERRSYEYARDIAGHKTNQGDNAAFYIADLDQIHTLMKEWTHRLPRVRPFYAVNCNANPVLLRVLASYRSIGFHCTTRENMLDALMITEAPERIFYANPCWTRRNVTEAARNLVPLLSVDSYQALKRVAELYPDARILINIELNVDETCSDLGCPWNEAPELLAQAADLGLNCVGVGFNMGPSASFRPALYRDAIKFAAQLFDEGSRLGMVMNVLNLGGGFSAFDAADSAKFATVAEEINYALDYYMPLNIFSRLEVIATPGRFFAGPVFSLVTNVIERADVDASCVTNDDFDYGQKAFVYRTNEGYYGPFGCRVMPHLKPECAPLFDDKHNNDLNSDNVENFYGSVVGPNGWNDEFDVVQSVCRFRQLSVGDWLFWSNMGAYSMKNRGVLDESNDEDYEAARAPLVYYFSNEDYWPMTSGERSSTPTESLLSDDEKTSSLSGSSDEQSDTESITSDSNDPLVVDLDDAFWAFVQGVF